MSEGSNGPGLAVHRSDDRIRVEGEIDRSNRELFEGALSGNRGDAPRVLDLSAVEFMDSGALAVLIAAADQRAPGRPILVVASPFVRRLLRITGLDRHEGISVDGETADRG